MCAPPSLSVPDDSPCSGTTQVEASRGNLDVSALVGRSPRLVVVPFLLPNHLIPIWHHRMGTMVQRLPPLTIVMDEGTRLPRKQQQGAVLIFHEGQCGYRVGIGHANTHFSEGQRHLIAHHTVRVAGGLSPRESYLSPLLQGFGLWRRAFGGRHQVDIALSGGAGNGVRLHVRLRVRWWSDALAWPRPDGPAPSWDTRGRCRRD